MPLSISIVVAILKYLIKLNAYALSLYFCRFRVYKFVFLSTHKKQVSNSLLVTPLSMQIRLSTIDNQY